MKRYTLIIAILWSMLFIYSCFSEEIVEEETPAFYKEALTFWDDPCIISHSLAKVITKHGNYLDYEIIEDSLILICWGNDSIDRTMEETFHCIGSTNWIPEFIEDNEDFINIFYGCGMPCWGNYILPLDEEESVLHYPDAMLFDITMNRVVYVSVTDTTADQNIIVVEDFKEKKQMEIHMKYPCNCGFMGSCLEEVRLTKRHIYYKWGTCDGEKEEGKVRLKF